MLSAILFLISLLTCTQIHATDGVILNAKRAAGIKDSDSLQVKINLILHLLGDKRFLYESSPDPKYADRAMFKSTSKEKALKILEGYRGQTIIEDPFNPYNLGTERTPSEMISQRIGGLCETYARTFASILQASGIPASRIRIVDAVTNDDYRLLCPKGEGSRRDPSYPGSNGHAMVMVKSDSGQWKLINTSLSAIGSANIIQGTHQQKLLSVRDNKENLSDQQMNQLIRSLDETDLEIVTVPSPEEIERSLAERKLVQLPKLNSLPEYVPGPPQKKLINFRDLSVFLITTPDQFPKHNYDQRLNLIASGKVDSSICRFNPKPSDISSEGGSLKHSPAVR